MADEAKRSVGKLAGDLARGYYSFVVAHHVAANPVSINALRYGSDGRAVEGELRRKDGTAHTLNTRHYLDELRENRDVQDSFLKLWATGSFLTLGNELSRYGYFERTPLLELIYHLRNGVAHGNTFHFTDRGLKRLRSHPAHNSGARVRSPAGTIFEVTADTSGSVLFEFMGAADVIDLLQSIEISLGNEA